MQKMYNLPSVVQEARVAINEVELKLGFQHRAGFGSCRQTLPMVMQNRSFQRSTRSPEVVDVVRPTYRDFHDFACAPASPEFVRVLWIGY